MTDEKLFGKCSHPEFVGTALLDTIGLVVPSVEKELKKAANIPDEISAVGLISSRTGAAGQILAVDEAVKSTNCTAVSIELPRDTKGWGGHGNYIVIGGKTVTDAKQGVKTALELIDKHAGEVYISEAGHLEFAFSSSAGEALNMAFGAEIGKAFGFLAASPAAIGFVLADSVLKDYSVKLVKYMSPSVGTSHSNEVIIAFTGETGDVKSAVISAREKGMELLTSLGSIPESPNVPYIK
jgi:microcompartment protein PduB